MWFHDLRSIAVPVDLADPLGNPQRCRRACFHARVGSSDRSSTACPRARGFILPWPLPLRRTFTLHLVRLFRGGRSLSGFPVRSDDVDPERSSPGSDSLFRGLLPPPSTTMLVASRLPPCRWARPLTGCPAAMAFVVDFEASIRVEIRGRFQSDLCRPRSPLQVYPSLGVRPTPRRPGSPGLSARGVRRRGLRRPMAATLAFSVLLWA